MFFKCTNCGGNVVYNPEKKGMFCPYCDSMNSEQRTDGDKDEMQLCPNCSGELTYDEYTSAMKCSYCETSLILTPRIDGEYRPKKMIPFQIGKETCKKSLRQRFRKNLFAPDDFLSDVRLDGMKGVYVPYWLYEYQTHCEFRGQGRKVRTWMSGNTEYTETSIYDISRSMDINFDQIPVDASIAMPNDVMDLIEPFDYKCCVDFDPKYLSGFCSEKYNFSASEEENRASQKMKSAAEGMIKESYAGYQSISTTSQQVQIKEQHSDYALLPVWHYDYSYNGQDYPFYINGQNGKIVGEAPLSKKKALVYSLTSFVLCYAILVLVPLLVSFL